MNKLLLLFLLISETKAATYQPSKTVICDELSKGIAIVVKGGEKQIIVNLSSGILTLSKLSPENASLQGFLLADSQNVFLNQVTNALELKSFYILPSGVTSMESSFNFNVWVGTVNSVNHTAPEINGKLACRTL